MAGLYIDATVGLGGHSLEIAKRLGAPGHLIGFDKDPAALEIGAAAAGYSCTGGDDWPQMTLLHASFAEVATSSAPGVSMVCWPTLE